MAVYLPLAAMSVSAPTPVKLPYIASEFAPEPNPLSTGSKLSAADLKSKGALRPVSG